MSSSRNKPGDEVVKVGGPAYLEAYAENDTSLDGLKQYRILPRITIVQGSSAAPLKDEYGEGGVILRPENSVVAEKGKPFLIVPLFFWAEWCVWSDINDKASPCILERTFDAQSEIAQRANNPKRRFEDYDGSADPNKPWQKRWIEHLTFACVVYGDHPLRGTSAVLSYEKGEHGKGCGFISAIANRKVGAKDAPLWSQVWELKSARRERGGWNWMGFDHFAPENPFILEDEVETFQKLHTELKEKFAARELGAHREHDTSERPEDSGDF